MDNTGILQHIQIHLTEHCNLNCKSCAHFSNIAEEEFYDVSKFEQDIKRLSEILNKQLKELVLLGGEPLLHPQINDFFDISRKYFPYSDISVYTNGILLNQMDTSFWEKMRECNISLVPSIYPIKINWDSVIDKADAYGVNFIPWYNATEKITHENINMFRKNSFFKIALTDYGWQGLDYSKCYMRQVCTSMYDGKIYPCCVIAYIRHFNKKYGKNYEVSENDFIDIYKISGVDEIFDFLKKQYPFCRHCFPFAQNNIPWECSSEHDISEWRL